MNERRDDPAAALRHPLWWAALATLLINDHVLKGAGVLPGWLTGKLSDVAGMLVAPALAASLIPLRRRGTRVAAFGAVALLFALIKLSPEARDALVSAAALLGMRWRIVVDPTDLIALAALPVGWSLTRPAAGRRVALQRTAMALGGVACMATSQPDPVAPGYEAQVFVANNVGRRVELGIRFSDATVDCAAAQLSPGTVIGRGLFQDEIVRVTLDPRETFPLDPTAAREALARAAVTVTPPAPAGRCGVVLITGEAMSETVVLWPLSLPRRAVSTRDPGESLQNVGRVSLTEEGGLRRARALSSELSVQPLALSSTSCDRRGSSYSWSDRIPPRPVTLRGLAEVPGGCVELTLDDDLGASDAWFLCAPRDAVPFAPGDRIEFTAANASSGRGIELRSDRARLAVWRDVTLQPGASPPDLGAPVDLGGFCLGHRDPCGAFTLPRTVRVGSEAAVVPGEGPITLSPTRTAFFGRAEHVLATRPACDPSLRALGVVVDYTVTTRGL